MLKGFVAVAIAAAFIYAQFFLNEEPPVVLEDSTNTTSQDKP